MAEASGYEGPSMTDGVDWSHRDVRPPERWGLLGLFGPVGVCFLVAALCVGLGLVMAATWTTTAKIPDDNSSPNNYWNGIYVDYGTLISPRHEIRGSEGAQIHLSSTPDPGPPPADWKPPPTADQMYAVAHRPVYIAETLVGVAALVALFLGFVLRRRRTADELAATGKRILVTFDELQRAAQDEATPTESSGSHIPENPPERRRYPWLN